ncbi:MAG: 50S ribosomal protein L28 [Pseudomonadaceae bacterium]|nr:50S ribosomal protein L28 [Pseudomonadaceae bacterium]
MARICDFTGKRTTSGSNVSHSNAHTKRTFKPNLQEKSFFSEILGRALSFRLSTRMIRTIDKYNGIDGFLSNVKNRRVVEGFSPKARAARKEILKASEAKQA